MDKNHDDQHVKANCPFQHTFFEKIIKDHNSKYTTKVLKSYLIDINEYDFSHYDAFLWTGGLGNIYENNSHNKKQLEIFTKIVELGKPIWGSCWGLQVFVTVLGGKITKSSLPEFGFANNIKIKNDHYIYRNKKDLFTAPGHHYDSVENIPNDFKVISENDFSIQSIVHKKYNIICTQYHPELPYNFIGNLMTYWKTNYLDKMTGEKFSELIHNLEQLENRDIYDRKLELVNWLNSLEN